MKKLYLAFLSLWPFAGLFAQSFMEPGPGYKVAYFFQDTIEVQNFDVNLQYFFLNEGDSIYRINPYPGGSIDIYPLPSDYDVSPFPSFLKVSPDGNLLWAAYTDLYNTDARIYRIDLATGQWQLAARMPASFDLVYWNDSLLVSGLNSADYTTPNGIFILDTTGADQHRKIIDCGGSSAGLAVDAENNLYYATSLGAAEGLYRWSSSLLETVINNPGAAPLGLEDAELLSSLPMGANDCEVDLAGHVIFTMNQWGGSEQVLAVWNGITGSAFNYDTLALSSEWLGMVKTRGDYSLDIAGNSIFTSAYGQPLADLHTADYPPYMSEDLPHLGAFEGEKLDLSAYFVDLDDSLEFELTVFSEAPAGSLVIEKGMLSGTQYGQFHFAVEASSGEFSLRDTTLVAIWPVLEGAYELSDGDDLSLEAESYWNGSDGAGSFSSGPVRYYNAYDAEWYSWSGWAYSNTSDVSSPGYGNQYSAYTGAGFNEEEEHDSVYAVSYASYGSTLDFSAGNSRALAGAYITNSTYAALSMKEGDDFAKKFGGADGKDPDYFKLIAWGRKDGNNTEDSVEFFLADYRFAEDEKDYLIETWQWIDLRSLGKVDSVQFALESSDMGEWGMNTPGYFCLDDVHVLPDAAPVVAHPMIDFIAEYPLTDTIIDLSGLFTDADDPDDEIVFQLVSEEDGAFTAEIVGDELRMSFAYVTKSASAVLSEIVIEGISNGLAVRDSFEVSHDAGAIENKPGLTVSVYPNPSAGLYTLEGGQGERLEVRVYSLTGTLLYENLIFESGTQLDIRKQPPGSYMLRIQGRGGIRNQLIQKL